MLELLAIDAEQLLHPIVHVAHARHEGAVGKLHLGRSILLGLSLATLFRTQIIGAARNPVAFASVGEFQLDESASRIICIIAAQARGRAGSVLGVTARLAEQREAYGVEDHRLARTGVTAYQVHAGCTQRLEIDFRLASIRTECAQSQLQGPHRAPPSAPSAPRPSAASTVRTALATISACSSSIGFPTCSS